MDLNGPRLGIFRRDVRTFDNFVVPVLAAIDVSGYNTAIVWCESFGQFITAEKYR